MDALGVRLGFSFSAGLFDYVINFGKATRPWLLIPVGLVYFGVYYAAFRFAIVRFDLKTPGREPTERGGAAPRARRRSAARPRLRRGAGRRGQPGLGRRLHDAAAAGGGRPGQRSTSRR